MSVTVNGPNSKRQSIRDVKQSEIKRSYWNICWLQALLNKTSKFQSYERISCSKRSEIKRMFLSSERMTVNEVILNDCFCQRVLKKSFFLTFYWEWNVSVAVTCLSGPIDAPAWLASLNSSHSHFRKQLFIHLCEAKITTLSIAISLVRRKNVVIVDLKAKKNR